jgi:hypothetical protein
MDETRSGDEQISPDARKTIDDHHETAAEAAKGGGWWRPRNLLSLISGASVERVISQLDAVETELLRLAPPAYLRGQMPNLLAHVELHLDPADPRRARVEEIAGRPTNKELRPIERGGVIAAVRAASTEARLKVTRLRSFRNVILATSLFLALGALGMAVVGWRNPSAVPLCFSPANNIVCPTSTERILGAGQQAPAGGQPTTADEARVDRAMRGAADPGDIAVVELVGLIAAAVAAAAALRGSQGTSTPYSLPISLAVLKLPTGALTAILGLLLMRGGFVPGLSALDSSAQIIAWAIIFGYAQQLLTRLVDRQAKTVLDDAGGDQRQLSPPIADEQDAAHPTVAIADRG